MSIFDRLQETFQYLWDGVTRLFSASDDQYPNSGVQPYEGDPSEERES
jgi:hypothetical protein